MVRCVRIDGLAWSYRGFIVQLMVYYSYSIACCRQLFMAVAYRYRKHYAIVVGYLFALVAVFYDWAAICGYFLFDFATHHYWLVTGSVVVGVCPESIQNRPKNKGRPEIMAQSH